MVEQEMDLARRIAADYRHRGIDHDDLCQVAFLALVKAAQRFDEYSGTRFPVFASVTINGEIKRHFRDHGWAVRPPRSLQELALELRRAQDELAQELGTAPTVDELATHVGVDRDDVIIAMHARASYRSQPIGPRFDDDDEPAVEPSTTEPGFDAVSDELALVDLVGELSERDQRIVDLRFREQMTQSAIADEIGLSQVQISRLLSRIVSTLRGRAADRQLELAGGG